MAKKKKTHLKPVARGFATTSVPKKPTPAEASHQEDTTPLPATDPEMDGGEQHCNIADLQTVSEKVDPDQVEEQSLQNLVDKFQEKTEKEITRTLKNIEQERRLSKSLPTLDLDPVYRDRIIELAKFGPSSEEPKPLDDTEERALLRLAITYGVLRRLGFSESRVELCLRTVGSVDLDEAFEWLYIHCADEELMLINPIESNEVPPSALQHRTNKKLRTSKITHSLSLSPESHSFSKRNSKNKSPLDATAPIFIPTGRQFTPTMISEDEVLGEHDIIKARVLALADEDPDKFEDPTSQYVRVKLECDDIISNPQRQSNERLQELRMRLETLRNDYLFDEKEAIAEYIIERDKMNTLALQRRLRESDVSSPSTTEVKSIKPVPSPLISEANPASTPNTDSDLFDDDISEGSGGILGLLDIMSTTSTDPQGMTITVRDMSYPKNSGRMPKTLLHEIVTKLDRYAAISYTIVSGSSRAKRASVGIRWGGSKEPDEWCMKDVACLDEIQAEQYIATFAIHSLNFPLTEGFASGNSATHRQQTSFRHFPVVFRRLWEELEVSRRDRDDRVNRSVWAKLRTIIESKLYHDEKLDIKSSKTVVDKGFPTLGIALTNKPLVSEQLATAFKARQASSGYQEMLSQRKALPIAQHRDIILQKLYDSQVLVLSGETGCGKSTQVPAFILEDQLSRGIPCRIYCTEPRRISAISLAQRVSHELGDPLNAVGTPNSLVGYSIRLESNISKSTRLAYVTNGIALRMLEGGTGYEGRGTAFDEITHIIIDEVHERTIESDFLLIVLKSLLEQRPDLKVILMSATLDAEKIANFFGGCPMLHVPGRTFPVNVHFLEDAVEYVKWSVSEGSPYARRSHDKYYQGKNRSEWAEELATGDDDDDEQTGDKVGLKLEKRYSQETVTTLNFYDERLIPYDLIMRLLEKICFKDHSCAVYSSAILVFMPGLGEIRRLYEMLLDHPEFGSDAFKLYPLHSTLSSENQGAVFDFPPDGIRKIVIATNIAETGITIPDITCVIDSGKHREMRFDEKRQISRLVETFIAKSNAIQRRGRAGRVKNGLCFHLFTKIRHDTQMADNPLPEMMRLSLSDLALRIKIMKIKLGSSIEDVFSRALDPPVSINVQRAISMLVEVRALTTLEEITPMGRLLSKLPTDVHLGKFLLISALFRCLDPALTIAATLNSKSPFVSPLGLEQESDRAKQSFKIENSDFLTVQNAFSIWRRVVSNPANTTSFVRDFCRTNFLSYQNLQQIEELRQQFLGYMIDSSFIQVDQSFIRELSRARYGRNRNRFVRVPAEFDSNSDNFALVNAALVAGLYPKVLAVDTSIGQMRSITNNQSASIHPSSVNFGCKPVDFGVNHLAYFTLMHSKKLYAWETGPVDDISILLLCGECEFKPVAEMAIIDRKLKFQVSPKTSVALKLLRTQIGGVLAHRFRSKPLSASHNSWNEMGLMVLGKSKPKDEKEEKGPQIISY